MPVTFENKGDKVEGAVRHTAKDIGNALTGGKTNAGYLAVSSSRSQRPMEGRYTMS